MPKNHLSHLSMQMKSKALLRLEEKSGCNNCKIKHLNVDLSLVGMRANSLFIQVETVIPSTVISSFIWYIKLLLNIVRERMEIDFKLQ